MGEEELKGVPGAEKLKDNKDTNLQYQKKLNKVTVTKNQSLGDTASERSSFGENVNVELVVHRGAPHTLPMFAERESKGEFRRVREWWRGG